MIEDFIKDLFDEENSIEIQRNDLAEKFNCVPSQINYVISTRFKPAQGYYVESKRGGGGHITLAGAQVEGMTMEEVKQELIIRINEYFTEIEN